MADVVYNTAKQFIMDGTIDLDTDTLYVLLVTNAYTEDIDAHEFRDDVTANEVANGNGYTTNGKELTTKVVAVDDTNDWGVLTADDLTWAASTITAAGAVLYKYRAGAASADELIAYFDFGGDQSSTSGNFNLNWHANGVLTLT